MANTNFLEPGAFAETGPYRLMPCRFEHISSGRTLVSSQGGEFAILPRDTFDDLLTGSLTVGSREYLDLKAKGFLTHGPDKTTLRVVASQWRTKKALLEGGPKLHIFVPTLRCNQSCGYCQASRANMDDAGVDMTQDIASRSIDLMLTSPSPRVVMEFQGGEALANFEIVRWMTERATEKAQAVNKDVSFVICTNLTLLTNERLEFFRAFNVAISTSLDGPADIHNRNRPLTGASSYDLVTTNIRRCQDFLGPDSVSALMTTTTNSFGNVERIVDEYVRLGLTSIFIRELNPYGFAVKTAKSLGYTEDEFVQFYKESLAYILNLNRSGTLLTENYAKIILRKILTPFGVGFVDLQSPTGEGFGVVLYNYDGNIYASDEGRMLAEMGDPTFRLGHVSDQYTQIFLGETMQYIAAAGVAEALPGCSDCAFVPYCGADPIRHYRTQNDLVGNRPSSGFCKKQKGVFRILFDLLADADQATMDILLGWIVPSRRNAPRPSWLS